MPINKFNSLIILDWDNTLFPSTWVMKNSINLNNPELRNKYMPVFSDLDDVLFKLFVKIMKNSKLIIVTNALPIWIKISSSVLPKTKTLLKYIKVISARKQFQKFSQDATDWKKMAFKDELNNETNIISIGDALYEYKALINLYEKGKILKSVKFIEEPSYEVLKDQIEVLINNISDIINHPKHLDIVYKEL